MLSSAVAEMEDFENQEVYFLGDLNFNLFHNSKYILDNNANERVPWAKKYSQFCHMHNLKQLIRSPTRVAKSCSTLLDHILTNANEMVSQSGVLDIGLSDHQLVFCTRKKQKKIKLNIHKTIKTRSFKKYSAEKLCNKLNDVKFPNYSDFCDVNHAFIDLSEKLMKAVDEIAPYIGNSGLKVKQRTGLMVRSWRE